MISNNITLPVTSRGDFTNAWFIKESTLLFFKLIFFIILEILEFLFRCVVASFNLEFFSAITAIIFGIIPLLFCVLCCFLPFRRYFDRRIHNSYEMGLNTTYITRARALDLIMLCALAWQWIPPLPSSDIHSVNLWYQDLEYKFQKGALRKEYRLYSGRRWVCLMEGFTDIPEVDGTFHTFLVGSMIMRDYWCKRTMVLTEKCESILAELEEYGYRMKPAHDKAVCYGVCCMGMIESYKGVEHVLGSGKFGRGKGLKC